MVFAWSFFLGADPSVVSGTGANLNMELHRAH